MHILQSVYHLPEEYFLWHDWHWIKSRVDKIVRDRSSEQRWALMSSAAGPAFAFHGKEASAFYDALMDATYTDEDRRRMAEQQEAEAEEALARQREQRLASLLSGERKSSITTE